MWVIIYSLGGIHTHICTKKDFKKPGTRQPVSQYTSGLIAKLVLVTYNYDTLTISFKMLVLSQYQYRNQNINYIVYRSYVDVATV